MANTVKTRQTLMNSTFEVFEKMFYIFLEPSVESTGRAYYRASIKFSGALKGEIAVMCSRAMAEVMVQNMLNAKQEEITEKILEDCLKESVNMICGSFLRGYDPSTVFDLSLPLIEADWQGDGRTASFSPEEIVKLDFVGSRGNVEIVMSSAGRS